MVTPYPGGPTEGRQREQCRYEEIEAHLSYSGAPLGNETACTRAHLFHKAPHAVADSEAGQALRDLHVFAVQEDCLAGKLAIAAWRWDCIFGRCGEQGVRAGKVAEEGQASVRLRCK